MFNSEDYKKGFKDGVEYAKKHQAPVIHTASWISEKVDKSHYNYYCDHCDYKSKFVKSNFCPNCGYMMNEEQEKDK